MGPVRQMLRQVRLVFNQSGCLCVDRKAPIGAGWFFGAAALVLSFGGVPIAGLPLPSLLRQVSGFAPGVRTACPRPDYPS